MRMKSLCKKIKVILLVVFLSFQFCLINQASAQSEWVSTSGVLKLTQDERKVLSRLYRAATGEKKVKNFTLDDLYIVYNCAEGNDYYVLCDIAIKNGSPDFY